MEIILKNVPMYFESIYEPSVPKGSAAGTKPAYGARYVIEPGSENDKIIKAAIDQVAEEKWPGKSAEVLKKLRADKRMMYAEFDYTNKDGEVYEGFENAFSLGTRSEKVKPTIKDKFNQNVAAGDPGAPYGGCRVHVSASIWAMDNDFGRRINAETLGVMFAGDGVPVGGSRPATDSTFANLAAEPAAEDFV